MLLRRKVEYHRQSNTFLVLGDGVSKNGVQIAGTVANLNDPMTIHPAARSLAHRIGDIRHTDTVDLAFEVVG